MGRKTLACAKILTVFFLVGLANMSRSAIAAAKEDACSLLAATQISGAVGVSVGAGSYVTPTFKKTCTWTGHGMIVTLFLESLSFYQAGKHAPYATPVSGIGDEAYYSGVGGTLGLVVKKGNSAFKVSVYAKIPAERKRPMEMMLARQIVAKL